MSATAVIGGKELILLDWHVLAVCSGLDFETGGTMKVSVYFDPELDPERVSAPPSAEEYKKYFTDPEMIALAMKQAQPRVKRSPQMIPILALDFASRDHDPYFDWVLDLQADVLFPKGIKAVQKMGRPADEAAGFLAELLPALGELEDWGEVNRQRFSGYRLLLDAKVAELLALPGESVPEQSGDYVAAYVRRFG